MLKNSIGIEDFLLTNDRYEYVNFPNMLEMLAAELKSNLEKAGIALEKGYLEEIKIREIEAFFGLPAQLWGEYRRNMSALTVLHWLRTRIKVKMQKEKIDFFYVYDGKGYDFRNAFIPPTEINNHKLFSIITECLEYP